MQCEIPVDYTYIVRAVLELAEHNCRLMQKPTIIRVVIWVIIIVFLVIGALKVRAYAPTYQAVQYPEEFLRIAECESRNNPQAKNPNSSASGRFQIIKSTWQSWAKAIYGDDWINKDIFDYETNTLVAWYGYQKEGNIPWKSSSQCWNPKAGN